MKKTIGLVALSALIFVTACNDEKASVQTTAPVPAPTKTEVIVVKPAPAPAPAVIVTNPPAKATTITLDKNGVKVGTKKVDIQLRKD